MRTKITFVVGIVYLVVYTILLFKHASPLFYSSGARIYVLHSLTLPFIAILIIFLNLANENAFKGLSGYVSIIGLIGLIWYMISVNNQFSEILESSGIGGIFYGFIIAVIMPFFYASLIVLATSTIGLLSVDSENDCIIRYVFMVFIISLVFYLCFKKGIGAESETFNKIVLILSLVITIINVIISLDDISSESFETFIKVVLVILIIISSISVYKRVTHDGNIPLNTVIIEELNNVQNTTS